MVRSAASPVMSTILRLALRKRVRMAALPAGDLASAATSPATDGTPSRSLGTARKTSRAGRAGGKFAPMGRAAGASESPDLKSSGSPSGNTPAKRLNTNWSAASAPLSTCTAVMPHPSGVEAARRQSSTRS